MKGITDVGLTFSKDKLRESVVNFVDLDYEADLYKRRSMTC